MCYNKISYFCFMLQAAHECRLFFCAYKLNADACLRLDVLGYRQIKNASCKNCAQKNTATSAAIKSIAKKE